MKIVASIKQRWAVWVWQHTPHCTDMARLTSGQVGSHMAGWFSFQPLFDRIVREQPDLLE